MSKQRLLAQQLSVVRLLITTPNQNHATEQPSQPRSENVKARKITIRLSLNCASVGFLSQPSSISSVARQRGQLSDLSAERVSERRCGASPIAECSTSWFAGGKKIHTHTHRRRMRGSTHRFDRQLAQAVTRHPWQLTRACRFPNSFSLPPIAALLAAFLPC